MTEPAKVQNSGAVHALNEPRKSSSMKTLVQVVLPIVIIVGLIGGLAFMSQYTAAPPTPQKGGSQVQTQAPSTSPLVTEDRTAVWDPKEPSYAMEFEKGSTSHYDFWIANRNPKPVKIHLTRMSCTSCSRVDI